MSLNSTARDWQPGDGIRCSYSKMAPTSVPCGPPSRTRIVQSPSRPGGPLRTVIKPLCANHADVGVNTPGFIRFRAEKAARERLIVAHYDEYLGYLAEEAAKDAAPDRRVLVRECPRTVPAPGPKTATRRSR